MPGADWIAVGRKVCITGRGTDAMAHRHTTIARITKTLIVCESGDRFGRTSLNSVPHQPYGGTEINPTCQRKTA